MTSKLSVQTLQGRKLTVALPSGEVTLPDVQGETGASFWNGPNRNTIQHDGPIVLKGEGKHVTVVTPGPDAAIFADDAESLTLRDMTLRPGSRFGVYAKNVKRLIFRNVHFENHPRYMLPKWGVHTTGCDVFFIDCSVDLHSAEHFLYAHGYAKLGVFVDRCDFQRIGAEHIKVATRPFEVEYVPDAQIFVRNSRFGQWFSPESQQGGKAVVLQGCSAAKVTIKGCLFYGEPGRRDGAIFIDDGLSYAQSAANNRNRYYAVDTGKVSGDAAPGHFTTGHVLIDSCGFQGHGGEIVRVGTIYPGSESMGIAPHYTAKSVILKNCGAYGGFGPWGSPTRISIKYEDVPRVAVNSCNTPGHETFLELYGMSTDTEAEYQSKPLSEH